MRKKWVTYDKSYDGLEEIMTGFGVSELLARALINRGIDTAEKAEVFLRPDMNKLHNPDLLAGMGAAVERILAAIEQKQKICIYGDYDVDGITSTSICMTILTKLDASVTYYIPKRLEEGYGISMEGIDKLKAQGIELIITVDCGIRSVDVVRYANELGIDVVITDHHECGDELPPAVSIVNPHRPDCSYPFKELAGVGVAYKLMEAVTEKMGCRQLMDEVIEIAAVGTIADVVALKDENRILVKHGLEAMSKTKNVGLAALLDICGLKDKVLNAYNIAFMVAPRMNAAGRIANADLCVELLLTGDKEKAYEIAEKLDAENRERQSIEGSILKNALEIIERDIDPDNDRIIVIDAEDWHVGVIGIVASRIVERFHLPTALIARDGKTGKGSARSIAGFNLYEAMSKCGELFEKFGGHELAAGFSISCDNIEAFKEKIKAIACEMTGDKKPMPELLVDYRLSPKDITIKGARELRLLEPFGSGNPSPLFVYRGLQVLTSKTVGSEGKHLSMLLYDGASEISCIGYNLGEINKSLKIGEKIDIVCCVEINNWNNIERIQLNIKDIKKSKN